MQQLVEVTFREKSAGSASGDVYVNVVGDCMPYLNLVQQEQ